MQNKETLNYEPSLCVNASVAKALEDILEVLQIGLYETGTDLLECLISEIDVKDD